jgi:hypothetical protein
MRWSVLARSDVSETPVFQRSNFYSVFDRYEETNQIRKNETSETCSTQGGMRNASTVLVGKREGKRPLVRSRHRLDLKDVRCEDVDCVNWDTIFLPFFYRTSPLSG